MTGPFTLGLLYKGNAFIGKFRLQRIRVRANDHDDLSRVKRFCSGNDMREYGFARNGHHDLRQWRLHSRPFACCENNNV